MSKDEGELFTTITRHDIAGAQCQFEQAGHLLEGLVSDSMTKAVIEALEVVDVQEHKAKGHALTVGLRDFFSQSGIEGPSVLEASEAIVESQDSQFIVLLDQGGVGAFQELLNAFQLALCFSIGGSS